MKGTVLHSLLSSQNLTLQLPFCSANPIAADMTTSKRLSERKTAKFDKNISRRGLGALSTKQKLEPAHIVLILFAVLVAGSFLVQIIRMALKSEAA